MNLKDVMERGGLKKSSLVELVLKDGVEFKILGKDSNEFPYNTCVYSMPEEKGRNSFGVKGLGYMVEIDDEKIHLVQNFSPSLNENDNKGYVGGSVYYFNAIKEWKLHLTPDNLYDFVEIKKVE